MILRLIFISNFILILTFDCSAQNYIDYLNAANEAEHEFVDGSLDSAKKILVSLEKKYHKLKVKDNFYLGLIYYFENDTAKGKEYLIKCAELRLLLTEDLIKFKSKFPELNISESTLQQIKLLEKKELPAKEYQIRDTIKELVNLDQEDRMAFDRFDDKKDFSLQKRLLNFLQKNGIPNPYIQGEELLIIIPHINDTTLYGLYKSFLYKETIKGNVTPLYYCMLVDRILYKNEKKFLYKVFAKDIEGIGKEQYIKNRKKIGLSPYYQGTGIFPLMRNK